MGSRAPPRVEASRSTSEANLETESEVQAAQVDLLCKESILEPAGLSLAPLIPELCVERVDIAVNRHAQAHQRHRGQDRARFLVVVLEDRVVVLEVDELTGLRILPVQ